METYPIETIDIEKAREFQFKLVDIIHRHFRGDEFLHGGDYGVVSSLGKPIYTEKVEKVIAEFFGGEACILVRGAGTGAIRNVINAKVKPNEKILIHDAPIYPTSKIIIESMGLEPMMVDLNRLDSINEKTIKEVKFCLIQHSRQRIDDRYNLEETIKRLKKMNKNLYILVDDNYVVMKVEKIGIQSGGDISAFSLFKLLGPEGIGCIIGDRKSIKK